ncbi:hypothetical protein T11_13446 [Trichinella zimbabwensis]|uniref:Uncharacterized protein n=1 Tax=Trichinella zimbabwensis TaxID=268475 RepID=A0A0V1GCB6_9BILA|nr:hypothetical protein T11_13446 [Trichinella zimbabwensis]
MQKFSAFTVVIAFNFPSTFLLSCEQQMIELLSVFQLLRNSQMRQFSAAIKYC